MTARTRDSNPDAQALRTCAAVRALLDEALTARGGWLSFDEYLRIVLYAPGAGYYSAGSVKFGRAGDFVTAPELSALFGRCVSRQCAEVLRGGDDVLEFGAGSGVLAATILESLDELGCLPEHYYILEVSADLRQRQQQRLAQLPQRLSARCRWLERLPASPISGVVLANEVADALPFRRFAVDGQRYLERGVALDADGALIEQNRPAGAALSRELAAISAQLSPWPDGYQSEICLLLDGWVAGIGAALARGLVLISDYGMSRSDYYHAARSRGTLRCHFRHRAHDDVLLHPGAQDISAWVDYTRLALAADAVRLDLAGYCTQAAFLLATGIETDVGAADDTVTRARLAAEARQLLLPGEMGEYFKFMALTRGLEAPLRGFALQDLCRTL